MQITPEVKNIRQLLNSKKQFLIPRFQREYSWEKKNYEEFLDDIIKGLKINDIGQLSSEKYFLGTMLFIGSYTDGTTKEIEVVDGQQRLTTITILFSAMAESFKLAGEEKLSKIIFDYIMTTDDNGEPVRILKTSTSYPFFSNFIQDATKSHIKDPSSEEMCIKGTYDFFKSALTEKNIRKLLKKFNASQCSLDRVEYTNILKAIRDRVLNSVFVSISTDTQEQANMIFEILNAKGKRLASIDLIKNKLFESVNYTEPADYATDTWNEIKKTLTSRKGMIRFESFYRQFWNSKYKKTADKDLYDEFNRTITTKERAEQLLSELEDESKQYVNIVYPQRSDYDNKKEFFWLVQSLRVLNEDFNITQVRVILLALFDAYNRETISGAYFKKVILLLENFHFVYNALTSKKSNKFESMFSRYSIMLRKANSKIDGHYILDEFANKLKTLLPKYNEFEKAFIELTFTRKKTPDNLKTRYVLNKLNSYYANKEVFDDQGSVEHILPEIHDDNETQNIGNLILLEQDLNGRCGNKEYSQKKSIYSESSYTEVKKFISDYETWSKIDIKKRAKKLAKIYYDCILKFD